MCVCIGVQVCMPLSTHTETRGIRLYHPLLYSLETSSHLLNLKLGWQSASPSNLPVSAAHGTGLTVGYTARPALTGVLGLHACRASSTESSPQSWIPIFDISGHRTSSVSASWLSFNFIIFRTYNTSSHFIQMGNENWPKYVQAYFINQSQKLFINF